MADTFDWMIQNIIVGEIFITYCMFWATDMLSFLKWGYEKKEVFETKKVLAAAADEEEGCLKRWDNYEWKRTWTHAFVMHMLCAGVPLMYAPYIYAAVVSWLHFLVCVVLVVLHLLGKGQEPDTWSKVFGGLWTLCRFFNILLIIGGLAGVGSIYIP